MKLSPRFVGVCREQRIAYVQHFVEALLNNRRATYTRQKRSVYTRMRAGQRRGFSNNSTEM